MEFFQTPCTEFIAQEVWCWLLLSESKVRSSLKGLRVRLTVQDVAVAIDMSLCFYAFPLLIIILVLHPHNPERAVPCYTLRLKLRVSGLTPHLNDNRLRILMFC